MYNLTNTDQETGIRYSTIYGNRITPEALDDITIYNGTDTDYEEIMQDFIDSLKVDVINSLNNQSYVNLNIQNSRIQEAIKIFIDALEIEFNENYEPYEPTYLYTGNGYEIEYHTSDNSLIILKSPYYTYSRLASPCFPNGCYLPDYDPTYGHKCYCLDNTFYSPDDPAPYQFIYHTETNKKTLMTTFKEDHQ
jgi:hypothetical protein